MWKVSSTSIKHAGPQFMLLLCILGMSLLTVISVFWDRVSRLSLSLACLFLFMFRSFTFGRSGFFCPCIVTRAEEAGQGLLDMSLPGALLPFPMRYLTTVPTGQTIANVVQIVCMSFFLKLCACRSRCMQNLGFAFTFT